MYKDALRPSLMVMILAITVVLFQNCGGMTGFEPKYSVDQSSVELLQDPGDQEDPHPLVKKVFAPSFEPLLADRYYLQSLFKDVFGPFALTVDSTRSYLNAVDHGSACSLYRDHLTFKSAQWVSADPMETCSRINPKFTTAQVNPKPTITRQALLARACSDLTSNNITMNFVLKRISPSVVPARSPENVVKLFHLFYRTRPRPHEGLIDSLLLMLPTSGITLDHWRVAVNTVCTSSYWQVL